MTTLLIASFSYIEVVRVTFFYSSNMYNAYWSNADANSCCKKNANGLVHIFVYNRCRYISSISKLILNLWTSFVKIICVPWFSEIQEICWKDMDSREAGVSISLWKPTSHQQLSGKLQCTLEQKGWCEAPKFLGIGYCHVWSIWCEYLSSWQLVVNELSIETSLITGCWQWNGPPWSGYQHLSSTKLKMSWTPSA